MNRVAIAFLALGLLFGGHHVVAVETTVIITPDKAFYRPGEAVTLEVRASTGSRVVAQITHLAEHVATLTAEIENGVALLTWTPPAQAPTG